jgi:hypothetical protein
MRLDRVEGRTDVSASPDASRRRFAGTLREQRAILQAFDCSLGQGFLFARPLEAEQLRAVLAESRGAEVGS